MALVQERRAQTERAGLEVTRALSSAVDAELGRSMAVLRALAIGPALDRGDLAVYHRSMQRALEARPDWLTITLADPSGQQLLNTRRALGEPLGKVLHLPSHHAALRTRTPVVGPLTTGPAGETAVPVRLAVVRDGEARYVLTAALKPDAFVALLERQRLPSDWVVSIFDGDSKRVARSRRHEEFFNQPPSPSLQKMMQEAKGDEGTGVTTALEGDEIYTAFSRSRTSGWTVAIGIPAATVRADEMRALATYGAGLLVSLVLATVFSMLLARAVARQEAENERARAAAENANRAKDEFLAMLGHELRNPLGALSNASWLLRDPRVEGDDARRARDVVARQVEQLTRLTDDLLDAGRVVLGKIELKRRPLDLARLVEETLSALHGAHRLGSHRVERRLEPAWVEGDPARLEQIVMNLVGNATKFTPVGRAIRVNVARQGSEAVLRVEDEGAGMPPELVPRVFDAFVQGDRELDRAHGGLGVGLTLVRRLAELHGGSASAASPGPGRGSSFEVRLPAIEPSAGAAPDRASRRTPVRSADILIIEDNADAASTLRGLLELRGHRVRVARDGAEGLEAMRQQAPDVALVDIGLPGIDGYEVARRARAALDGSPSPLLVALTGYGLPEDRSRALAAGFDEHLVKPVDPDALEALFSRGKAG